MSRRVKYGAVGSALSDTCTVNTGSETGEAALMAELVMLFFQESPDRLSSHTFCSLVSDVACEAWTCTYICWPGETLVALSSAEAPRNPEPLECGSLLRKAIRSSPRALAS